jgi:hypothetical protein
MTNKIGTNNNSVFIKNENGGFGPLSYPRPQFPSYPVLQPNTTYYLNFRNEAFYAGNKDPEMVALQGVDLCDKAKNDPSAAPETSKPCGGVFQLHYTEGPY